MPISSRLIANARYKYPIKIHPLYYFAPAILTYINGACNCRIDDAAAAEYNAGIDSVKRRKICK